MGPPKGLGPKNVRGKNTISDQEFSTFLVIHSESNKQIGNMAPFLVSKVPESHICKNFKAKRKLTRDPLVEVEKNNKVKNCYRFRKFQI